MAEGFIRAFSGEKYQLLPLLYRAETEAGRYGTSPTPSQMVVIVKIALSSTMKFLSLNLHSGGRLRGEKPCCYRAHPWLGAGGRRGGEWMKDRFSCFPAHVNMLCFRGLPGKRADDLQGAVALGDIPTSQSRVGAELGGLRSSMAK